MAPGSTSVSLPRSPAPIPASVAWGLKIGRAQLCPFSGPFVERLREIRLGRNPSPPFSMEGTLSM
jgi:hypothetical protein